MLGRVLKSWVTFTKYWYYLRSMLASRSYDGALFRFKQAALNLLK